MEVITYSEWIEQSERQTTQQIALLAAQRGVDGIAEFDTFASFPVEGVKGILYLAEDTGKIYSWNVDGATYIRSDAGTDYSLPVATDTVLGGVKIGDGLTITDGVLDVNFPDANVVQNIQIIAEDNLTIDTNTSIAIGTVNDGAEEGIDEYSVILPASSVGKILRIKNMGSATMMLIPVSGDTIDDDDLNIGLLQYDSTTLLCYAENKWCEL
jgi:hypothetical protein